MTREEFLDELASEYIERRERGESIDFSEYDLTPDEVADLEASYEGYQMAKKLFSAFPKKWFD
ncbi:MAG: hypothetical protein H8D67_24250, partial [Deltaproteobacteria bacterium]|nr:hypothetical protein [Deltaproteobacteria bacterium]